MIDRLIALSVRHRGGVLVAAVALAVVGVRAVYRTPVDAIPDLSENQVLVFAAWPGHSPPEVEDQVGPDPLKLRARGVTLAALTDAVARSNAAVGGDVVHKGNAEFVVRGAGSLGAGAEGLAPEERTRRVVADLERVVIPREGG